MIPLLYIKIFHFLYIWVLTFTTDSLEAYEAMSKDELIQELVKARIAEARLKKGYEVKGDGTVIHYSSRNTR